MEKFLQAKLDTVGKRCLKWTFFLSFIFSLFFPLLFLLKILLLSSLFFFLIFWFVCYIWTPYPEVRLKVGFLVSFWHTFLVILGGILGGWFGFLILKLAFPYLKILKTWFLEFYFKS